MNASLYAFKVVNIKIHSSWKTNNDVTVRYGDILKRNILSESKTETVPHNTPSALSS